MTLAHRKEPSPDRTGKSKKHLGASKGAIGKLKTLQTKDQQSTRKLEAKIWAEIWAELNEQLIQATATYKFTLIHLSSSLIYT